jgi:Rad3-related DNA helicase
MGKTLLRQDSCPGIRCTQYDECFFIQQDERRRCQLLIVNHHLLFSDLACVQPQRIQPNRRNTRLQMLHPDEAHNLEETGHKTLWIQNRLTGYSTPLNKIYVKKGRRELGAGVCNIRPAGLWTRQLSSRRPRQNSADINEVIIPARVEIGEIGKDLFDTIARSWSLRPPNKENTASESDKKKPTLKTTK